MNKIIIFSMMLFIGMYGASAATVYVDTNGTGDYNCDGTDDQIEINYALNNATSGDVVHINAGTYNIDNTIWVNNSNIVFEGDGASTVFKIVDNAAWPKFQRMVQIQNSGVTLQNMVLDGNYWGVNGAVMPTGHNYGDLLYLTSAADYVTIQDMVFNTTRNDGILVCGGDYLHVSNVVMHDIAHDGIHGTSLGFSYSTIADVSIDIQTIEYEYVGNAGIRPTNSHNNLFTNVTVTGMAMGIELEQHGSNSASHNVFDNFTIIDYYSYGVWTSPHGTNPDLLKNTSIKNTIIAHTHGTGKYGRGVMIDGVSNDVSLDNVVIYGAYVGIDEDSYGGIRVKNCIITDAVTHGIDGAYGNIAISYSDVWNSGISNYNGVSAGTGCISSDPLFADPTNHDFHLISEYGRCDGATWVHDDVTSPCIGAGVPKPDGTRTNLGAYGNTIEASKSRSDVTPLVTNLRNDPPAQNTITLRWDCSALDIDHYTIHQIGAIPVDTVNKYYSVTDLSPDTTYTFDVSATNTAGIIGDSVSITVRTAAEDFGSNTVHIADDITASQGGSVTVPIMIHNATGVACAGVNLNYDASVVTVTNVTGGCFTSYIDFDEGHVADGQIILNTYINGTQLTGEAKVADVTLVAVGEAGGTSPLDMEIISMADQDGYPVPGIVSNGLFTVVSDTSPPIVTDPSASQLIPDDTDGMPSWGETATLNITVTDESDIASVTIDLSAIGGLSVQPMTYIWGNVWSVTTNASAGTPPQTYELQVCATDIHGYTNMSESVELVVMRNGDVTGDGDVKLDDVKLLGNCVTHPDRKSFSSEFVADVTGDGVMDIADAMLLANHVVRPDRYTLR